MSRTSSSYIASEEVGAVVEWNFNAVDQSSLRFAEKIRIQAEEEERIRHEAVRQAGFAEGYAQGHARATLEGDQRIAEYAQTQGKAASDTFFRLFETAQAQFAEAEQSIAQGVLELACELARQVLRHEIATNPVVMQPVVREALGLLATDGRASVVRLNPADVEIFSDVLQKHFSHLGLTLLADAAVSRGGCLVEHAGTVVDGTVERRWQRAVAGLGLQTNWEGGDDAR